MYILLINNVVVQKQPNLAGGFVWTDEEVVCGQIEKDGVFTDPDPDLIVLTSEQIRDNDLAAIDSYDYGDGRVIQIRTKDRPLIEGAIGKRYAVTDEDLQSALDSYESQFKAIWLDHLLSLEEGVLL